jgi:ABC-type transporter Mla subunit MlaD
MTSPWPLGAAFLLAILIGAMLPVLYQLYQTLKTARAFLDTTGPQLRRALDQVGQAANRVDRIGAGLEAPMQTLKPLLESASSVGQSIGRSGAWLGTAASIGGALAPALIAGVSALFTRPRVRRRTDEQRSDYDTTSKHAHS